MKEEGSYLVQAPNIFVSSQSFGKSKFAHRDN